MTFSVGEFIKEFIPANTRIRLWKIDKNHDNNSNFISMLMYKDSLMSWEVEAIPEFANLPFIYITDAFFSEQHRIEPINILTNTTLEIKDFYMKRGKIDMKLSVGEFIKEFVAPNSLIRLWKDYKDEDINGHIMLMKTDAIMSWEIQDIPQFSTLPFVCITDIVTDRNIEAINIITDTELTRDECEGIYQTYRMNRERENRRGCYKG